MKVKKKTQKPSTFTITVGDLKDGIMFHGSKELDAVITYNNPIIKIKITDMLKKEVENLATEDKSMIQNPILKDVEEQLKALPRYKVNKINKIKIRFVSCEIAYHKDKILESIWKLFQDEETKAILRNKGYMAPNGEVKNVTIEVQANPNDTFALTNANLGLFTIDEEKGIIKKSKRAFQITLDKLYNGQTQNIIDNFEEKKIYKNRARIFSLDKEYFLGWRDVM